MRGDDPRNGHRGTGAVRPTEAVPDVFDLVRRRTREGLAALVREGVLPAGLDLDRFTAAPPRPGAPGDVVVDAALVCARESGVCASRLASATADQLRAAPEVERVAVAGGGVLVLTLRPATLFDAVSAVLRSSGVRFAASVGPAEAGAGTARSGPKAGTARGPSSLGEARARVSAEIRAALAAASGRAGAPPDGAAGGTPRPSKSMPPVLVRGRLPDGGDVLAWIGTDAFRFAVAACREGEPLHLDLDVLGDRTCADPSFSARFAHARACGLLRRAAAAMPERALRPADLAAADPSGLTAAGELQLARFVARHAFAVASGSPRRLAVQLGQVAEAVHSQWSTSKQQPQLPFVNEEMRVMAEARLGLMAAAALVLRSGLDFIGIAAPDEMP